MTASPLVSAVIPTFNKALYLREAVESVLAQSYSSIEILIVNDGSEDNSAAVAQELVAAHPARSFTVINQDNRGISAARNAGLSRARGEIFFSLDADDRIDRTYVEKCVNALTNEPVKLVCSDVQLFGVENGEWIPEPFDPYYVRYNNCIPTAAVYHRSLFDRTGGYKVAIPFAEDWEFFVNATRDGVGVKTIREKLYHYRRTDTGLLGTYLKDRWEQPASLIMLANHELYNVEDLRFAQEAILKGGRSWEEALQKQDRKHPNEWLLKFTLGIFCESHGQTQAALELFGAAAQLTNLKHWMPIYRLAVVLERLGKSKEAADLYHEARILRPDVHFLVVDRIKSIWGDKQQFRRG